MRTPSSEPKSLRIEPSGPGGSPRSCSRQVAVARVLERGGLDGELGQALADERAVPGGRAVDLHWRASAPSRAIWSSWPRPPPALRSYMSVVMASYQPSLTVPTRFAFGHRHVHEEDLVEVPVAVHQDERAHRDARRLHVDQEVADAAVLGRGGIGAHEQEDPVGELGARGPHLLAVDDEVVAAVLGAGATAPRDPSRRRARRSPGTRCRRR